MFLILNLIVLLAALVEPKKSADRYASLELQLKEMKSDQLALSKQLKVVVNEIKDIKLSQLAPSIQPRDDDKTVNSKIKDVENIKKKLNSKMHLIERKLKYIDEQKIRKDKPLRINGFEMKQKFDQYKTAINKEIAELGQQLKDMKLNQSDIFSMNKKVTDHTQQLNYTKLNQSAMKTEVAELTQELNDTKLEQSAMNKEIAELGKQLKDMKLNQSDLFSMNKEVTDHTQQLNYTKLNQSAMKKEVAELKQELNDAKLEQSAMKQEVTEFAQQLKGTQLNQTVTNEEIIQLLKDMKLNMSGLHKFTTTQKMRNLAGTKVPKYEWMGPISLFDGNGNWEWKGTHSLTQKEVNKRWSQIKTSKRGSDGIYSSPIVLPSEIGELCGYFGIWPHDSQHFYLGFFCYEEFNENQLFMDKLPIYVNVKVKMSDLNGDICLESNSRFKITKLHSESGPSLNDLALIKFTDKLDFSQFPNVKLTLI